MRVWLEFAACAALILWSGSNLSRYGDILAEKTGLGRTWIGVVLLASITSLAELVTGITSVRLDLPDLAVGDVLGSCMFNLVILAIVDFGRRSEPISTRAHQGHVLTACFGILLLGSPSLLFVALYLLGMRLIFTHERRRIAEFVGDMAQELEYQHVSVRRAVTLFVLNAALIVVAAVYLPHVAERIAVLTGLGQTFVGTTFVALSTSLPEVVVSLAALRIGAVDMVYGNVLGSNLFNIAILAVDDLFYLKGPLLQAVTPSHLFPALVAISMSAIAVAGLTYRAARKPFLIAWDSLALVGMYLVGTAILFAAK
jgi:cation:H+ antiporter